MAPRPGAARSQPRPAGPTCRMSFAKIGSSATAPPNNTANRSSVMAARNNGFGAHEAEACEHVLRASVCRWPARGVRTGMVRSITTNTACPTAAAANAAVAPPVAAISNPPAAGPMIDAS